MVDRQRVAQSQAALGQRRDAPPANALAMRRQTPRSTAIGSGDDERVQLGAGKLLVLKGIVVRDPDR